MILIVIFISKGFILSKGLCF